MSASVPGVDYYAIAEVDHLIQNPTSPEKLDRLIGYCGIADGQRVLDIGCGKAWLLRRMAQKAAIKGLGLDVRDVFLNVGRRALAESPHTGLVELKCMPALELEEAGPFDVALCIGAPFAIGTFVEAIDWLIACTKPAGVVAIGDLFALKLPWPDALRKEFGDAERTMTQTVKLLESKGLAVTGIIETSLDDWNHYESQRYRAIEAWARANPAHPDRSAIWNRHEQAKKQYLELERDYLGWAIFVCRVRKPNPA